MNGLLLAGMMTLPLIAAGESQYSLSDGRSDSGPCGMVSLSSPAEQQYREGSCLIRAGEWVRAAAAFHAYTALEPEDFKGWLMLSRAELHGKNLAQARNDVLQSVALNSNSVEAYRTLGEVELELHNYQAAYEAWLKAHEVDPKDGQVDYYLGRLFFEAEFWNESAAWFRQALQINPKDFAAMTYLGTAGERLKFQDTSMQLYRAAIQESKSQGEPYSWAYLACAKLLHQTDRDPEAIALLQEAERVCPEAHALALLGQLLASSQPGRAEALLRRALSIDNALPEAHYRLALLLRSEGHDAEAQAQLEEFHKAKAAEQASQSNIQAIRKGSN